MGKISAQDMAAQAEIQKLQFEAVVAWHLQSNHYPPHPSFMVAVAMEAIKNYQEGNIDQDIALPDNVSFRGSPTISTSDCMQALHLYDFISNDDDE